MTGLKKYWKPFVIIFIISMFLKPALCFFMLGSLCLFMGLKALLLLNKLNKKGVECNGRVLSIQVDNDGYKTPVVEFTPMGSEAVKQAPVISTGTDVSRLRSVKSQIDKEVLVLYDPENPKDFIIAGDNSLNYFVFILFSIVGLIFIIVSICWLFGYIKMG